MGWLHSEATVTEFEERNDLVDHARDNLRTIGQKWNDRLTLNNLRLIDRYLEGEIEILIHLRRGAARPGDADDFCASLKHDREPSGTNVDRPVGLCSKLFDKSADGRITKSGVIVAGVAKTKRLDPLGYDEQDAVLVGIVQLADDPDRLIPSLVRLDGLDEAYHLRSDSLYLSRGSVFQFGRGILDRETNPVDGLGAVGFDQPTGQVIERHRLPFDGVVVDVHLGPAIVFRRQTLAHAIGGGSPVLGCFLCREDRAVL